MFDVILLALGIDYKIGFSITQYQINKINITTIIKISIAFTHISYAIPIVIPLNLLAISTSRCAIGIIVAGN